MSASQLSRKLNERHPLQRLASPSKGFSGAFHVVGLLNFYTAFKFLSDNPNKISESYGWHFQYLTILGLAIATLSFLSALLADITSSHTLFTLKNYLALVATPIEVLISILYWGLSAISPTLVIPPDLPPLPLFNDLTFHLFPALLTMLDYTLLSPPWPTTPMSKNASRVSLATSTALAFAYWFWIEQCYQHNGYYPYPIFTLLSTAQRVGLFALSGVVMWLVGAGLRALYARVNGLEMEPGLGGELREKKGK